MAEIKVYTVVYLFLKPLININYPLVGRFLTGFNFFYAAFNFFLVHNDAKKDALR